MTIIPDSKDWTWVLERPCPECGFSAGDLQLGDIGPRLRVTAEALRAVLAGSEPTARPAPDVWSPLEYACHVRDVFRIFRTRLELMLAEDGPHFANWDQDATALEGRYAEQQPSVVSDELGVAVEALAQRFEQLPDDVWDRSGYRSDGAVFTVSSLGRYLVHDPVHHVWDVRNAR